MNPLVQIVDDDADMQLLLQFMLSDGGYQWIASTSGAEAIDHFRSHEPSLILLDIELSTGGIDGYEVCRRIRRSSDVPIVFLTARDDTYDQLVGFTLGADDFIVKPVTSRVLLARVNAALRRTGPDPFQRETTPDVIQVDSLTIDVLHRSVTVHGVPVELSTVQFDLLTALATDPARPHTREQLTAKAWKESHGGDHDHDLLTHISRLRKKILAAGGPRIAHVLHGGGIQLIA